MNRTLVFCFFLVLCSCGTRDYPPRPTTSTFAYGMPGSPPQSPQRQVSAVGAEVETLGRSETSGFLWSGLEWFGVADSSVESLKAQLVDSPHTNSFRAVGTTVFGGAVVGVVVRTSGSWFFGKPQESKMSHWFWKALDGNLTSVIQASVRGGVIAGACHLFFVGLNPLPFYGALGPNYRALSSAIVLGGMSSMAWFQLLRLLSQSQWSFTDSGVGRWFYQFDRMKTVQAHMRHAYDWSANSEIGKMVIYRVAPGLFILGLSGGVGLLVYHQLRE